MNTEGSGGLGDLLEGQNLVVELIARGESLYQVLDTLLRVIQLQCPGMLASILLLDPDGSHVRHGAAPDLPEDYVRAIDGLSIGPQAGSCGTAAFTRKPVIVGDVATDPLWNDYRTIASNTICEPASPLLFSIQSGVCWGHLPCTSAPLAYPASFI